MNTVSSAPVALAAFAPRSFVSRAKTVLRAGRALRRDPNRLDLVLEVGDAVNAGAFARQWTLFERDPVGATILAERPAIDSQHVDLDALAKLPDGTLGREYARFIRDNGLTMDVFYPTPGVDPHAAYMSQRYRQTHDVWHVVLGYRPDVEGEVLLQAFTFAQLGLPNSGLIAFFGGVMRAARGQPAILGKLVAAYRAGRRAKGLGPVYWEKHWEEPVAQLRERFGCAAASG
jgi:ubiquinone biosynthesis protein COQ4